MTVPRDNLDEHAADLILYLAGELPAQRRQDLEQRLSADAALRGELDDLRLADEAAVLGLRRADAARGPAGGGAALRSAEQAVEQWAASRVAPPPSAPRPAMKLHVPRWVYPAAAAAALFVAFMAWWGGRELDLPRRISVARSEQAAAAESRLADAALVESVEDALRMDMEQWTLDVADEALSAQPDAGGIDEIFYDDERMW
jgi:hypothetical protein